MGYTHYWGTEQWTKKDKEGYAKALPVVQDILNRYKGVVQFECGDTKPAVANKKMIRFNGIGDEGHETFMIFNKKKQSDYGSGTGGFCKTARKAYDIVVCEVLLVMSANMPGFSISSDGFYGHVENKKIDGEWDNAMKNVKRYGIHYHAEIEGTHGGHDGEPDPYCSFRLVHDPFVDAVDAGMTPRTATDVLKRIEEWDKEMSNDEPISGTDMVDWFCSFYQEAKKVLQEQPA